MIALRQLVDDELYLVVTDGDAGRGVSRGSAIKRAMKNGGQTKVRTFFSTQAVPGGYVLCEFAEGQFIAVRGMSAASRHQVAHVEPVVPSEPKAGAPKPSRGFKKLAPPPAAPAKPVFAKPKGFTRRS